MIGTLIVGFVLALWDWRMVFRIGRAGLFAVFLVVAICCIIELIKWRLRQPTMQQPVSHAQSQPGASPRLSHADGDVVCDVVNV